MFGAELQPVLDQYSLLSPLTLFWSPPTPVLKVSLAGKCSILFTDLAPNTVFIRALLSETGLLRAGKTKTVKLWVVEPEQWAS